MLDDTDDHHIVNIDISLVLEKPKIQPIINEMRRKISQYSSKINSSVNQISFDDISIKATTNEKIGYVGREEGVACHAVVLINKI